MRLLLLRAWLARFFRFFDLIDELGGGKVFVRRDWALRRIGRIFASRFACTDAATTTAGGGAAAAVSLSAGRGRIASGCRSGLVTFGGHNPAWQTVDVGKNALTSYNITDLLYEQTAGGGDRGGYK